VNWAVEMVEMLVQSMVVQRAVQLERVKVLNSVGNLAAWKVLTTGS
jgi:hypothetical protein